MGACHCFCCLLAACVRADLPGRVHGGTHTVLGVVRLLPPLMLQRCTFKCTAPVLRLLPAGALRFLCPSSYSLLLCVLVQSC